jgi:hypothetical protein
MKCKQVMVSGVMFVLMTAAVSDETNTRLVYPIG